MWILVGALAHVLGSEDPLARHDNDGNETSVRAPTQTSGWVVGPSGSMLQTESTTAENQTTNAAMACMVGCTMPDAIKALRTKANEVCEAKKLAAADASASGSTGSDPEGLGDDCCASVDLKGPCSFVDDYIAQFFSKDEAGNDRDHKGWKFATSSGGNMFGFGKTVNTSQSTLLTKTAWDGKNFGDSGAKTAKNTYDVVYKRKDDCSNAFGELKNAFVRLKSVKDEANEVGLKATAELLKTNEGMGAFRSALDNFKAAWENEALGKREGGAWTFKWTKTYQTNEDSTHHCFAGMDVGLGNSTTAISTRKLYDAFKKEWKFIATELNAARTAVKALVDNIKATADGSTGPRTIDLYTALTVKKEHKKVLEATVEALEQEVTRADPDKQPPGEGYAFIAKVNKCGKDLADQLQRFLDAANTGMPASGEMSIPVTMNGLSGPTGYYVKVGITESSEEVQKQQGAPLLATVLAPGLEGKLANDKVPNEKITYGEKFKVGSSWNVHESHLRKLVDNQNPPKAVVNHWKVHEIYESAKKCDDDANQALTALKKELDAQLEKVKRDAGQAGTDAKTCEDAVDGLFKAHLKENTGFKSLNEIPLTTFA